jgi:hypothetical protein
MATNNFLSNENINLLWEVLKEEEILKIQTSNVLEQITQIFKNNLKGFYETEKNKCMNLVDINKKYILLILNYVNTNYPTKNIHYEKSNYQLNEKQNINQNKNQNAPNKIQIYEEIPQKELITYEELQKDKRNQFDRDLNKRQEEFVNAMSMKVPSVPDFSDKTEDKPITSIEEEIKKITEQRNYDIELINKSFNKPQDSTWLNPLETSIKNEKLNTLHQKKEKEQTYFNKNENKTKYITINEEISANDIYKNEIIELNASKKNISWANNISENINDTNDISNINIITEENNDNNYNNDNNEIEDNNLFSKLKRKSIEKNYVYSDANNNVTNNDINNDINNDTKNDNIKDINFLKKEIENINSKIDVILNILNSKKNEINIS